MFHGADLGRRLGFRDRLVNRGWCRCSCRSRDRPRRGCSPSGASSGRVCRPRSRDIRRTAENGTPAACAPRTNAAVSSPETAPPANPTMSAATTQGLVPLAAVAAAARPVAPLAAACCDTPRQIPRPRARANRAKVFFSLPKKLRGLVVIGPGDFPFHRGEQHAPRLPAAQQEIAHPHIREQPVVSPIQKFLIRQLVFA